MSDTPDRFLSETDMREILDRAIRIQSLQPDQVTLRDLKVIGRDIGVSPESFDLAVKEMDERSEPLSRRKGWAGRTVTLFLTGGVLGSTTSTLAQSFAQPLFSVLLLAISALIGVLFSGAFALRQETDPKRATLEFQIKNAGLWAGFLASAIVLFPAQNARLNDMVTVGDRIYDVLLLCFMLTALVGGLLAAFTAKANQGVGEDHLDGSIPFRHRVAEKLKRFIDIVFARVGLAGATAANSV